ncbi:unnamed protein product [Arctogadus glacialis]
MSGRTGVEVKEAIDLGCLSPEINTRGRDRRGLYLNLSLRDLRHDITVAMSHQSRFVLVQQEYVWLSVRGRLPKNSLHFGLEVQRAPDLQPLLRDGCHSSVELMSTPSLLCLLCA